MAVGRHRRARTGHRRRPHPGLRGSRAACPAAPSPSAPSPSSAASLLRMVGVVLRRYFGQMAQRRMQVHWFTRVTDRYLTVPLRWFDEHPAGELLAHADADCERATMAMQPLPFSLGVVVIIVVSMVQLAFVDPVLLAVGVALFPSLAAAQQHLHAAGRAPGRHARRPASATCPRVAHESFEGVLVVKTLGLEAREVERLRAGGRGAAPGPPDGRAASGRASSPGSTPSPTSAPSSCCGSAPGGCRAGALTTGELVQAMALFSILAFPFRVVGFLLEELPRAVVAHDRITGVLAAPTAPAAGGRRGRCPTGPLDVVLDGVSFAYGDELVLDERARPPRARARSSRSSAPPAAARRTLCDLLAHLSTRRRARSASAASRSTTADPADLRRAPPRSCSRRRSSSPTRSGRTSPSASRVDDERAVARPSTWPGPARFVRAAPPRPRRGHRRAGRHAVRRPAPAARARPGPAPAAPAPPARRRHLRRRRPGRAGDPRRAAGRRPGHHPRRRPPRVHHRPGRPGAPPRRRPHRRRGHPPRAAGRPRLRRPRPGLRGRTRHEPAHERAAARRPRRRGRGPRRRRRRPAAATTSARTATRPPEEDALAGAGAVAVLRRGLAATPELRQGLALTVVLAVAHRRRQAGRARPHPADPRPRRARRRRLPARLRRGRLRGAWRCSSSSLYLISRGTFLRLIRAAEASLLGPAGAHVRRTSTRCRWPSTSTTGAARSSPGSRATSRPWPSSPSGAPWRGSSTRCSIVATIGVMAVYSWQLALVTRRRVPPAAARAAGAAAPPARGLRRRAHRGRRHAVGGVRARERRARRARLRPARPAPGSGSTAPSGHQYRAQMRRGAVVRGDVPAGRPVRRARARRRRRRSAPPRARAGASASASSSASCSS